MIALLLVAIILGVMYGKWFGQHGPFVFLVAPPRPYGTLIGFEKQLDDISSAIDNADWELAFL